MTPAQGFSNTVLIDAGSKDGLKVGMTVINGDGLVGRVKTVTGVDRDGAARHRPATTRSGYACRARSRSAGRPATAANQPLTYAPFQNNQAMTPGTVAVTWQQSQLNIPGGIPVGTIVSNQGAVGSNRSATIRPFVDFDTLDLVGVVVVLPRTDPRDRLRALAAADPDAAARPRRRHARRRRRRAPSASHS